MALLAGNCSTFSVEKALKYATRREKWQVVKILYEKCKPGCAALGEALKTAAKMGKLDVVELMGKHATKKTYVRWRTQQKKNIGLSGFCTGIATLSQGSWASR